MRIKLTDDRKRTIFGELQKLYAENFDEPLSDFRAGELLDFFMKSLGPAVYNQAIQDARGFMLGKLDDLDVEFHEPEERD